jgi:hypothetical protein
VLLSLLLDVADLLRKLLKGVLEVGVLELQLYCGRNVLVIA